MKFLKLNAKNKNSFWFLVHSYFGLFFWFIPNKVSVQKASSCKLKNLKSSTKNGL